MARPNILWLMTDEQRTDSLGCYGSPWARTPHLDRLAREGVLFETAATPSPVCLPARVSFLSARPPHRTGNLANHHTERDWPALTHLFRDAGYQTATFGKQHEVRRDVFETVFDRTLSDAVGYFDYAEGHRGEEFDWVRYPRDPFHWIFAGRFPAPPEQTAEAQCVAAAQEWLRKRDRNRPFFLRLSFNGPHTPVVAPAPWDTCIDPAAIEVPGASLPPAEDAPRWVAEHLLAYQDARPLGRAQLQRARQCYYGLVSFLDHLFGSMLEWMEHEGLLDNTIVAFVSDHGTHLGDHAMMQKQTFFEPVVSVPFFFWGPGFVRPGVRIRTPVETMGLLPTLLELAGLPAPEESRHLSLAATLAGGAEPPARPVTSELSASFPYESPYRPGERYTMIRHGDWKLTLFWDGPGTDPFSEWADAALYNLKDDPLERVNRIRDAACREVVEELAGCLTEKEAYPPRPIARL